jgi:hypothetical protein
VIVEDEQLTAALDVGDGIELVDVLVPGVVVDAQPILAIAAVGGSVVALEEHCHRRQRGLAGFIGQLLEQIAVVGTAGAAVQHHALIAEEVIGEAQARLPGVLEVLAVMPVGDVVVVVQATGGQAIAPGLAGIGRVIRIQRGDEARCGDEVGVGRVVLVIPAHADVQQQLVGDRPVILDVDAVLLGVGLHQRLLTRGGKGRIEVHAIGRGRHAIGIDLVAELGIQRGRILCGQGDVLVVHPHLDGVLAMPVEAGEGQIVLQAPAILATALQAGTTGRPGRQEGPLVDVSGWRRPVVQILVDGARADTHRSRVVLGLLLGHDQLVVPGIGAVLPTQRDTPVLVDLVGAVVGGVLPAHVVHLGFIAILARQLDAVVVGDFPVQLAEVQVLGERQVGCTVLRCQVGRQQADVGRGIGAGLDAAWHDVFLALVGKEEVHAVLDDRAAEGKPIFLDLRIDLAIALVGPLFAQRLIGVAVEQLAVELVGARLGCRGDGRAADLAELGLVVGGDDLVFADGQLRKWIALAVLLTGNATLGHVALLADAVDVQVAGAGVGGATAQGGVALGVDVEHHARHGVGKLQEVARGLRQLLDLAQRDDVADLRGLDVPGQRRGHAHRAQRGGIAGRRGGWRLQVHGRGGGHLQGDIAGHATGLDRVGARLQADDGVGAVLADDRAAHRTGGLVGDGHFLAGLGRGHGTAQDGGGGLGKARHRSGHAASQGHGQHAARRGGTE